MNLTNEYQRCLKATKRLGNEFPYYTPASLRVRFVEVDPGVIPGDTMAIDSKLVIHYNKKFVAGLNDHALQGVILHECMHYISAHHRRYLENPHVSDIPWVIHNMAMDMEINQHIGERNLPSDCLFPSKCNFPEGKSYEEYLLMLMNNPNMKKLMQMFNNSSMPGSNSDSEDSSGSNSQDSNSGGSNSNKKSTNGSENQNGSESDKSQSDSDKDSNGKSSENKSKQKPNIKGDLNFEGYSANQDESTRSQLQAECQQSEMEYNAKNQGSEHSFSESLASIKKIRYPWKKVFKSLIVNRISERARGFNYRTYHKRNKHMMGIQSNIVFGSYCDYNEHVDVVIGVDISGSMGSLVESMYGVIKSIIDVEELDISVKILECDTEVSRVIDNFDMESTAKQSVGHGGGTDMGAIGKYIQDQKWDPDLIVVMTDNYTGWDPVLFKNKTVVLTTEVMNTCPYKQYLVSF